VMRTAKESLVRGGWHHSDEFKAKLSVLHAGKTLTDEHRAKLSLHRKGRIENNLFREKARARQVGVIPSTQTKQKLSAALVNARANEVSIAKQKTRDVHALCLLGEKVYATCKQHQISPPTFYKYVALLQLPLLGHKSRGATS